MANSPVKPITAERWERVKEITADALELEPEGRGAFVAQACGDDSELLQEVLRLLREAESSLGEFLSAPLWNVHSILNESREHISDAPLFSPGQTIGGRFQIMRFLNRGGMGEVYSAFDLELKEVVALKTIRPSIAASQPAIDHFKEEVRQTRRITHPNICRVYDLFSHQQPSGETLWFLTMELLDGVTLAERLVAGGPLPMKQALPRIREMVAALTTAHDLGIVHRDFKPNNVMLVGVGTPSERAVVTDFGLAASVALDVERDHPGTLDGTPAYMAPERAAGEPAGFAADQYALGLVICEMLTGRRPEPVRSDAGGSRKQLKTWMLADRRSNAVIRRCLETSPQNRFPHVRDVVAALDPPPSHAKIAAWTALAIAVAALTVFAYLPRKEPGVQAIQQLTPGTDLAGAPSISRDGKLIAYESDRAQAGNLDIWVQPLPSGVPKRLTTDSAEDAQPDLARDGHAVVFRSERQGGGVYEVSTAGGPERLLASGGLDPRFSPDGRSVAYWIGDRDEYVPSGRLFVIPAEGGSVRPLAPEFVDARSPLWSSDGRFILFLGCRAPNQPLSICRDWWVIPRDGGPAVKTGAFKLLADEGIEIYNALGGWYGERVLFGGTKAGETNIWEITIRTGTFRATGKPHRLTSGDARELHPTLAENGVIVFCRLSGDLHIWQIAQETESNPAVSRKVTDDAGSDSQPSVSSDGRWLVFVRRRGAVKQLWRLDLKNRSESVFPGAVSEMAHPLIDNSGETVLYEAKNRNATAILIQTAGQPPRKLCETCGDPTGWLDYSHALLESVGAPTTIASMDTRSGVQHTILSRPAVSLGEAIWSPAAQRLLFTADYGDGSKQVFAVALEPAADPFRRDWIPITGRSEVSYKPQWSGDGRTVYYISRRDGFSCIWARRFDPAKGTPVGEPFAFWHFHNQRASPARVMASSFGMSVAGDTVYINVGEAAVSLWRGVLKEGSLARSLRLQ